MTTMAAAQLRVRTPALMSIAFRPFFILAALFAAIGVPLWLHVRAGDLTYAGHLAGSLWHGHEMIFGFAVAVFAGFLLTAAQNWTGRTTARGLPLGMLALLWIAARVLLLLPDEAMIWPAIAVDSLFLPAVALVLLLFAACARHIVRNIDDGWAPGRLAVLVRSASEGIEMAALLRQARVPAVVSGLGDVMQSTEAAELLLVLEAIAAPRHVARVRAALGTTLWGLSHADLLRLATPEAEAEWTAVTDAVDLLRERWTTRGLLPMLQQWYADRAVTERLLSESEGERRLTNLRHLEELLHAAVVGEHLNVEGTLRWLRAQVAEAAERGDRAGNRPITELRLESDADAVQIVTVHKSKGLEFPVVFLPGWEEGVFPSRRSVDEGGDKALEEERRLAYVGITRARRVAVISHAANRMFYGNWQSQLPSRFLDELPPDQVQREGAAQREARPQASVFAGGGMFAQRPRRVIEAGAWEVKERPAASSTFSLGERVFHQKFGYGRIVAIDDDRLDIAFEKAGEKRLLDRFVEKVP